MSVLLPLLPENSGVSFIIVRILYHQTAFVPTANCAKTHYLKFLCKLALFVGWFCGIITTKKRNDNVVFDANQLEWFYNSRLGMRKKTPNIYFLKY